MVRRVGVSVILGVLALLGPDGVADAQVVGAEASYHSVNFRGVDVQELAIPFGVTWRFGRFRFDANSAWAEAWLVDESGERLAELSGLTDVTTRLMMSLLGDRARVILAGNIPTGHSSLDRVEDVVATALATQLFAFPIATFGSGAGLTSALAVAQPMGSWVVGASGAYRVGGAYEPLIPVEGVPALEYRPGEEMRVRLALDRPVRDRWSFRLAGTWSTFGWDQQSGQNFFQPGDRLLVDAMLEFPALMGNVAIFGYHMRRGAGLVRDTLGSVLNSASERSFSGGGLRMNVPVTPRILFRPAVDFYYQDTQEGEGVTVADGYLLRAGAGIVFRLGGGWVFEPAAKLQFGELDGSPISGFVLRGGLAWAR